MITLTLIHPLESLPPQSWTFEGESIIRIGRASDNHVVLYSAVVSRHHVEVRRVTPGWEIVSLGANGTYINGEKILQSGGARWSYFSFSTLWSANSDSFGNKYIGANKLDIWVTSHKPSSV